MFQKFVKSNKSFGSSSMESRGGGTLSVIGPDVRIVGNILTQGEIQVDGQIEGDITCSTLVIGEGARISGEVTAEAIKVHGELTGKVNTNSISIARSARVVGDLTHETIEIEAGAHLEGHCMRRGVPPKTPAELPKPEDKAEPAKLPEPEKAPAAVAAPTSNNNNNNNNGSGGKPGEPRKPGAPVHNPSR